MKPDFSHYGIGLIRGEVNLVPHRSTWKDLFEIESKRILKIANLPQFKLHHIGSTAIFESGSEKFKEHILFRDILNSNPELRDEYEKLKLSLVENGIARENYSDSKISLISKVLNSRLR